MICARCARRSIFRCCARTLFFIPYQIYEARAAGADCILLIVAMLKEGELRSLAALTREVKMAALIEVHNPEEFALASRIGAELIGINNRDLHTFVTDLAVTENLLADYRGDALIVAESGISMPEDIRRLDAAGAQRISDRREPAARRQSGRQAARFDQGAGSTSNR